MKLVISVDMEGQAMVADPMAELREAFDQVLCSLEQGGTEGYYLDENRQRIGEWRIA
jgi:hypothetical protein